MLASLISHRAPSCTSPIDLQVNATYTNSVDIDVQIPDNIDTIHHTAHCDAKKLFYPH